MGKTVFLDVELPEDLIEEGRRVAARLGTTIEELLVKRMMDEVEAWEMRDRSSVDEL